MKSSPIVICALIAGAMAIRMHDAEDFSVNNQWIASDSDLGSNGYADLSDSYNDKEVPVPQPNFAQMKLSANRDIIDADGDGVEDNEKKTQGELDRFRKKVFDPIEEMHNTHNGEYPGHVRAGDSPMPTPKPSSEVQKKSTQSLVQQANPTPEVKPQVLTQSNADVNTDSMENLGEKAVPMDLTEFTNDSEYLQLSTKSNNRLSFLVNNIQSPEDLEFMWSNSEMQNFVVTTDDMSVIKKKSTQADY